VNHIFSFAIYSSSKCSVNFTLKLSNDIYIIPVISLHRAIEIAKLLAICAAEIERLENEDENGVNILDTDTLPGETHAIVCQRSLPAASSCLLGVLEKVVLV